MARTRKDEVSYVVPGVDIEVSQAWVNLIDYSQKSFQFGDLFMEINNSQPGKRIREVPSIRFDKQGTGVNNTVKDTQKIYLIQSVNIRIPQSWISLIQWVQLYFISGKIGFRIVDSQPTELLQAEQKVNFSKSETIPGSVPLNFTKV
jgi:hypothetical protein